MIKTYIVAGANWSVVVPIDNVDDLSLENLQLEVATRGVEAKLGKRTDIVIEDHSPIITTDLQRQTHELHCAMVELMTDELVPGCGIGMLVCVMDNDKPEEFKAGENHEWFISSKLILENIGVNHLIGEFNKRYPVEKKESIG